MSEVRGQILTSDFCASLQLHPTGVGQLDEIGHWKLNVGAALAGADGNGGELSCLFVQIGVETLVDQCQRADATGLQPCQQLGFVVRGHAHFLGANRFGQRLEVKRVRAGDDDKHWFATGVVGDRDECLEDLLLWQANRPCYIHRRMNTSIVVIGENLVDDFLAVQETCDIVLEFHVDEFR